MKKIFLSNGEVSLVSNEDHLYLSGYNWSVSGGGYVRARVNGKMVTIHRIIAERMKLDIVNKEIDHIDGDKLNNQRINLRIATRRQNAMNARLSKTNTSGYKGVTKETNGWKAQICVDGKMAYLGHFRTPEEAHQAYCKAAEKYFGEFSNP